MADVPSNLAGPDNGRVRVMLTLTLEEAALLDRARGTIAAAAWAKEATIRAAKAAAKETP